MNTTIVSENLSILHSASSVVLAVLYLLTGLSLLTWYLVVFKWLEFKRVQQENRVFADQFWDNGEIASVGVTDDNCPGQFAQLVANGLQACHRYHKCHAAQPHKTGDLPDAITRALRQTIQDSMTKMEAGLGVLATIGNTAPFIGLFGTVVGIMSALQGISKSGAAGLDVVAGPIGEALIATAVGLACAIPAVVVYNSLVRKLKILGNSLDSFAHDLLARLLSEQINIQHAVQGKE
jgi:biopolymer transport protein ExbB